MDLKPRLAREQTVPVPQDTAGIPGFPYMTRGDLDAFAYWRRTNDPAYFPPREAALDRFPIQVQEVRGSDITGWEIGVYDAEGELHELRPGPTGCALPEETYQSESRGTVTRLFRTATGVQIAVASDQTYQVVALDWATLDGLIGFSR